MRRPTQPKTIMITGGTDGIGLETAVMLAERGHRILVHGRTESKLQQVTDRLVTLSDAALIHPFLADLADWQALNHLIKKVRQEHPQIDVLINNAGVFKVPKPISDDGLDVRFVVNTLAPYALTRGLLSLFPRNGRVINLSSAAQAPVQLDALTGQVQLADDFAAYAQSKLAITAWSRHLAAELAASGPLVVAVNPGSLLGSKMVQEGFGVAGADIKIGADILCRMALDDVFDQANGLYFDNDSKGFAPPHPEALDVAKTEALVASIESILADRL